MADTTANYGWVKPVVGGDDDAWGGEINTDLDGIDATVKSVSNAIPAASSTPPIMDGTAAVGTGATFARADHVHPSDTTKYAASNPSGYQTAGQVTAALVPYALATGVPAASSTPPVMDGTAAVGAGTTFARADHVHPSDASRLALTGGTLTGPLTLVSDPTAALQPATKQYVDALPVAGSNRIINGDMRWDQRNNGATGTAITVYTVDRWLYGGTQAAKGTWGRVTPSAAPNFGYHLGFTSSSAYTALATDAFDFIQPIEADMVTDFAWGTPQAQPVTLSFWVLSSLSGTFSGCLYNAPTPATRSYPFTFSIPTANTWTKIVITIPGDTGGTWVMNGNLAAFYVAFDLGSGASFRGPAGAWASANYRGATGAVSVVATNGATFSLTGVKLEVGSIATPFNRQSLAKSLTDCQRYYQTGQLYNAPGITTTASAAVAMATSPVVTMRASPTTGILTNSSNNLSSVVVGANLNMFTASGTATAAGVYAFNVTFNANAEL
jgi:hypothetical protein